MSNMIVNYATLSAGFLERGMQVFSSFFGGGGWVGILVVHQLLQTRNYCSHGSWKTNWPNFVE